MIGMNATTGKEITGLEHLYQSIAKILTTPIGSRLARRSFGSELPNLIDAPYNNATRVRLYAATATALIRWEPRLKLTRVRLADVSGGAPSAPILDIEGYTTETGTVVAARINLTPGSAA